MAGKEVDALAFAIGFALKRKLFSRALETFFCRMPEEDFEVMCSRIADHLRRSNWRQGPPAAHGPAHGPLGSGLSKKD